MALTANTPGRFRHCPISMNSVINSERGDEESQVFERHRIGEEEQEPARHKAVARRNFRFWRLDLARPDLTQDGSRPFFGPGFRRRSAVQEQCPADAHGARDHQQHQDRLWPHVRPEPVRRTREFELERAREEIDGRAQENRERQGFGEGLQHRQALPVIPAGAVARKRGPRRAGT